MLSSPSSNTTAAVTLRLQAALPEELLPNAQQERALLAKVERGNDERCRTPCLFWRGGARVRYNGRRWQPRRLFFALCAPNGARRLTASSSMQSNDNKKLEVRAVCGTNDCVEPSHLQLNSPIPPMARVRADDASKKRKELPTTTTASDDAIIEHARKRMREVRETLARIEAVRASFPPELRNTPAAYQAEREAMVTPEQLAELRRTGRPLPRDEVVFMFVDKPP